MPVGEDVRRAGLRRQHGEPGTGGSVQRAMATDHTRYDSPLCSRYASKAMQTMWGDQRKFSTWRKLWVELARAEMQLGLPISELQVAELAAHILGEQVVIQKLGILTACCALRDGGQAQKGFPFRGLPRCALEHRLTEPGVVHPGHLWVWDIVVKVLQR